MEKGRYVLIVDDDDDARRILARIMQSLGIETRTAADGREALDMINQAAPSLIMLDLMMPVMNGFEVLFRLKARPETRYIPVVVISAVSQDDYLKLPGVDRVIRKATMRVAEIQVLVSELAKDLDQAASAQVLGVVQQPNKAEMDSLTRMNSDACRGAIKSTGGSLAL